MRKKTLLAIGAFFLIAAIPKEEPDEICQESIEGTWECVGRNPFYQPGSTWDFRAGQFQFSVKGGSMRYQYKTEFGYPYSIITFSDNSHGIFVVNGNSLKLCIVEKSRPLPNDFTSGSIFKRKPR